MKYFVFLMTFAFFFPTASAQWQRQTVDTKASLRGLSVVNQTVIWASGTGGTYVRTIDGGKTWTARKVPGAEKLDFRDIEAFDMNTAYLLSIGPGESSRIYKTADGGNTWKLQLQNMDPKVFLDAFGFWDKTHGIAMSDPVNGKYVLLETTDGETWKPMDTSMMPSAKEGEAAFAASGTCLITVGRDDVFLISGGNDARVFHSGNRGKTWTVSDTPIAKGSAGSGIFSIAMRNAKSGVIVGGNYEKPNEIGSTLAFTNDRGNTWIARKGLGGYRSGVSFVDGKTLIAVGSSGSDFTRNGGASWAMIDKENYNAVQSKGKNAIWAVGANGLVARYANGMK